MMEPSNRLHFASSILLPDSWMLWSIGLGQEEALAALQTLPQSTQRDWLDAHDTGDDTVQGESANPRPREADLSPLPKMGQGA